MNYTVAISDRADRDLEHILFYIADDNIERAISFVDELVDKFTDLLSIFPLSGTIANKEKGIRSVSYKKYTAFYSVDEEAKEVNILHVIKLTKTLKVRGINFDDE